jgi:flavin-dependent dehydrogenase
VAAFARRFSDRIKGERYVLSTIMGWYQGVEGCSDVVELFFDEELRPHYAWIFPETKERVNIGLCFLKKEGGLNARQHFQGFLDRRLEKRLRHAEQLGKWIGHPVQVSPVAQDLVAPGILRAGEAGWLADAATAEGIYHGLLSGRLAGRFGASRLLEGSSTTGPGLAGYQMQVQKGLFARLALGRALMGALKAPTLDWALAMGSSPVTQKALSRAFTGLYHG